MRRLSDIRIEVEDRPGPPRQKAPPRAPKVEAAPPQGLFLDRVFY